MNQLVIRGLTDRGTLYYSCNEMSVGEFGRTGSQEFVEIRIGGEGETKWFI